MSRPARLAAFTATLVLLITALVGVGWVSGSTVLRQGRSQWGSMKPVTAASLAILAGAVLCVVLGAPPRVRRGGGATYVVAILGVIVLVEYATGTDLLIQRLFGHADGAGGRPSPWAATGFVLLAAGLELVPRRPRIGQTLLVLGGLPGYVALIGYVTGVPGLYEVGASVSVALATASALPLVAVAGLAAVPDGWLPRIETGSDPGALLLRRVLPSVLVLIPALAALAEAGTRNGWWTAPFAVAFQSFGPTIVAAGGALWAARAIGHVDQMRKDADRRAHEDALTGAGNRWALERTLEELFDGPEPPTTGILMLMDLDDFKLVNDRFGHPEGDRVLAGFAEVVRASLRADDVFIRLGGDEFAVFCPHADPNAVLAIANRILLALEREKRHGSAPAVTASIGVAVCDGTVATPDELLARADAALYTAKHSGKGRFSFHPTVWVKAG